MLPDLDALVTRPVVWLGVGALLMQPEFPCGITIELPITKAHGPWSKVQRSPSQTFLCRIPVEYDADGFSHHQDIQLVAVRICIRWKLCPPRDTIFVLFNHKANVHVV